MEMRHIFGGELQRLMEMDEKLMVIDADLAKACGTIGIRERFPTRALDVGVAEQNMASIGAGLASYGYIPFICTFAAFASRRIADQAMISICYAGNHVKIVGTDPGLASALNGGTHCALEDVGIYRSFPNMLIFEPCDGLQLRQAIKKIAYHDGPCYMRMFRGEMPELHDESYQLDLFQADILRCGTDVTIAASGLMVAEALEACGILAKSGLSAEVIDLHTIKPLDIETLVRSVEKTGALVTAENHNLIGGLFSAAAETLMLQGVHAPVHCVGVRDTFGEVGSLEELKEKFGLTAGCIAVEAIKAVKQKKEVEKKL